MKYVPDAFKTREMCIEAVNKDSWTFQFVPDFFVDPKVMEIMTEKQRQLYVQRKTHKAEIKDELLPVAWHPDRYWDWCVDEEEKREISKRWC